MNIGNASVDYLSEISKNMADRRVGNTVILIILLTCGLVGNSIVIFVYVRKLRKHVVDRFFIPYLALVDLVSCFFSSVLCIMSNVHMFDFPSNVLCKIMWYMSWSSTALSVLILLLIALQRYLKICRPYSKQMDLVWRRVSLLICVVATLVLAVPLLFLTGHIPITVEYKGQNVTGHYCSLGSGNMATFQTIYFAIIFLVALFNLIGTVSLYIPIACIIYKSSWKSEDQTSNGRKGSSTPEDSNHVSDKCPGNLTYNSKEISPSPKNTGLGKEVKNRFSVMLLLIMSGYAFSTIPSIIMVLTSYSDPEFLHIASDFKMNIFLTIRRLYIVNNVVNPFIYGFFDLKFRSAFQTLFLSKFRCYIKGR